MSWRPLRASWGLGEFLWASWAHVGVSWGRLGASWGCLGVVWRPSWRRMGGGHAVSSSVQGRLDASLERLEPDFRTKTEAFHLECHFVFDFS